MVSIRFLADGLVFTAAVLTPSSSPATTVTCSQPITEISAPSPGGGYNLLTAVDAPRQDVAFAAGLTTKTFGGKDAALVEGWNGSAWKVQTTPHPWTGGAILEGVYTPPRKGVWVVGFRGATFGTGHPIAMHRTSTGWKVTPVPSPTKNDALFSGVSGVGSHPVFAVGSADIRGLPRTLIERWNGTRWSIMESAGTRAGFDYLTAVDAVTDVNVWAVGHHDVRGRERTLILHHTSAGWKLVKSPNRGTGGNILYGVVALGRNDIWAVGSYEKGPGTFGPLIEHWNGTRWKIFNGPSVADSALFYGVDAVSRNSVWAAGIDGDTSSAFLEHRNGTRWKVVSLPSVPPLSVLRAVAARPTGQVWTVGAQANQTQTLVFGRCT